MSRWKRKGLGFEDSLSSPGSDAHIQRQISGLQNESSRNQPDRTKRHLDFFMSGEPSSEDLVDFTADSMIFTPIHLTEPMHVREIHCYVRCKTQAGSGVMINGGIYKLEHHQRTSGSRAASLVRQADNRIVFSASAPRRYKMEFSKGVHLDPEAGPHFLGLATDSPSQARVLGVLSQPFTFIASSRSRDGSVTAPESLPGSVNLRDDKGGAPIAFGMFSSRGARSIPTTPNIGWLKLRSTEQFIHSQTYGQLIVRSGT